jgi:hypothetical protein
MKLTLTKQSLPTWSKQFDSQEQLRLELYTHICEICKDGENYNGLVIWSAVDENSSISDLLNTGCGCEFRVKGNYD